MEILAIHLMDPCKDLKETMQTSGPARRVLHKGCLYLRVYHMQVSRTMISRTCSCSYQNTNITPIQIFHSSLTAQQSIHGGSTSQPENALCIPLYSLGAANSSGAMTWTRRDEGTLWGPTKLSSQEQGDAQHSLDREGQRVGGWGVFTNRGQRAEERA